MARVLRVIVVLFAVFAVLNAKALEDKPSSDENEFNGLDKVANPEDLANNPAKEYNDNEGASLQEEAEGRKNAVKHLSVN